MTTVARGVLLQVRDSGKPSGISPEGAGSLEGLGRGPGSAALGRFRTEEVGEEVSDEAIEVGLTRIFIPENESQNEDKDEQRQ